MKLNRRYTLQLLSSLFASSALPVFANAESGSVKKRNQADDYRALVCLYLYGGNDSWNLLVPLSTEIDGSLKGRGYQTYKSRRADMAIEANSLPLNVSISSAQQNPYFSPSLEQAYHKGVFPIEDSRWGLHGCAPELAQLYAENKLAWIANTGVLPRRIRASSLTQENKPAFLFAHNHQQHALFTADASGNSRYGWAGMLADVWKEHTDQGVLGLNLAIGKYAPFMAGQNTSPLVQPVGQLVAFSGMRKNKGDYELKFAQDLMELNQLYRRELFGLLFREKLGSAISLTHLLEEEWQHTSSFDGLFGPYGEALFGSPDAKLVGLGASISQNLTRQFETVTRLMEIGKRLDLKRQIFSVYLGGFDTHSAQAQKHPLLIRNLSLSLWKFQKALEHLGLDKQVVTFTQSDFGRTLQNNGDGTDHGWGGNQLVMGGSIASRVHGTMPDLREDSPDMFGDGRGRVIPSIAAEQVTASLASWFGVEDTLMPTLFPNLPNFQTSDALSSSYLPLFK